MTVGSQPYCISPRLPVSRPILRVKKIKFCPVQASIHSRELQPNAVPSDKPHLMYKESDVLKIAFEASVLKKLNIYSLFFLKSQFE